MTFSNPGTPRLNLMVALPVTLALMTSVFGIAAATGAETALPSIAAYQLDPGEPAAYQLMASTANPPEVQAREGPEMPPYVTNQRFARLIDQAARKATLDPALVHAVIAVESGYNPAARSAAGAIGLMQLLPETAARYGVADPASSPEANLRAGTRYLRYLMELFDHRIDLALAAYNAGEHAVLRHGRRIPPYRETQRYVPAVLARYREQRAPESPAPSAPGRIQYMPGTALDLSDMEALRYRAGPR